MCIQGNEKKIKLTDGRYKSCDECIQPFVQMLNNNGYPTIASCCGHGKLPGNIPLEGGQEIFIMPDFETSRMVDKLFGPLHPRRNEWKQAIKRRIVRFILKHTI